ncbi:hypothetical protein LPTSP3_g04900 [Leptospira kobayashii]|uniref:Lcl C-terminal domain-containing protein n=1 Tax=Leptospira kobayashii TaxID=1917830 RepID=A0ABN6KAI7_9LEPT|nr:hypothetical protein LPTSP3_g04900 [Leptospira kobayashii]
MDSGVSVSSLGSLTKPESGAFVPLKFGSQTVVLKVVSSSGSENNYSFTLNNSNSIKLIRSGAVNCYNANSTITCGTDPAFPLQDAQAQGLSRIRSFTGPTTNSGYASDYITIDNGSGLTWKSCLDGPTGATCTGSFIFNTQSQAPISCGALNSANSGQGYAGYKDWRVPNFQELLSIVNVANSPAAIDTSSFPNWYHASVPVWTDEVSPLNTTNYGAVLFAFGSLAPRDKNNTGLTACVRGNQLQYTQFSDNQDGTIREFRSGLLWQKCANGLSGTDCSGGSASSLDWSGALVYCDSLTLGGRSDWRLPNVLEALSLMRFDVSASSAYIDNTFFPNTPFTNGSGDLFHSSTSWTLNPTNNLQVRYNELNQMAANNKTSPVVSRVRCVAGPD